jgi:glycosyltransferase involved in cell wall biosynthesis
LSAFTLSIVLPVCDEEAILERNVVALEQHLTGLRLLDRFEILLVCNGCRDGSEALSRRLAERMPGRVRALSLDKRGLGRAIRAGIRAASYDQVMFYAVDLPFGLTILDDSVAAARAGRDRVVIGSKGHADSRVTRTVARRLFSGLISALNKLVFSLDVRDTQGSLLFPRAIFERYHAAMDDPGAFFQAQVVIYGRLMGCEVVEIPVHLAQTDADRGTRFRLAGDGLKYVAAIVREKVKLIIGAPGHG